MKILIKQKINFCYSFKMDSEYLDFGEIKELFLEVDGSFEKLISKFIGHGTDIKN